MDMIQHKQSLRLWPREGGRMDFDDKSTTTKRQDGLSHTVYKTNVIDCWFSMTEQNQNALWSLTLIMWKGKLLRDILYSSHTSFSHYVSLNPCILSNLMTVNRKIHRTRPGLVSSIPSKPTLFITYIFSDIPDDNGEWFAFYRCEWKSQVQ